jgi:hypothetical protein
MLDVMREREPTPERTLSPCDFRAIAESFDLQRTPTNVLALMLAVGTGRFPRIEFAYDVRSSER